MTSNSKMTTLYELALSTGLFISSPVIALKIVTNPRFRFRFRDRIMPSVVIDRGKYMLVHTSSFGETKTILSVIDRLETAVRLGSVFSVFTDTAYKLAIKSRPTILMPADLTAMYRKIFLKPPEIAIFFETEIWPSYIRFLKDAGVPLALINARMSRNSFKLYSVLSPFREALGMFDLILAKSTSDLNLFSVFNSKCTVCGNIKKYRKYTPIPDNTKIAVKGTLGIPSNLPVITLGSIHKEEITHALEIADKLRQKAYIVLALRHPEDSGIFVRELKRMGMDFKIRSTGAGSGNILLLDTLGELDRMYGISDGAIIFGSFSEGIGGHNPIEPIAYGVPTVCGKHMDSFKEEVKELQESGLIDVVNTPSEAVESILSKLNPTNRPDPKPYFDSLEGIMQCYVKHLKKLREV